MCICLYIYVYVYILQHVYTYTYLHNYENIFMNSNRTYLCQMWHSNCWSKAVSKRNHTNLFKDAYTHIYIYAYIYAYTFIFIDLYIFIPYIVMNINRIFLCQTRHSKYSSKNSFKKWRSLPLCVYVSCAKSSNRFFFFINKTLCICNRALHFCKNAGHFARAALVEELTRIPFRKRALCICKRAPRFRKRAAHGMRVTRVPRANTDSCPQNIPIYQQMSCFFSPPATGSCISAKEPYGQEEWKKNGCVGHEKCLRN